MSRQEQKYTYNVGDGDVVLAVGEEQAGGVVDDVPETPSHHSLVLARSCEGRQGYSAQG